MENQSNKKKYKIKILKNLSIDERIKKYSKLSSHKVFQDPNTLKWFNSHHSESLIKKSVFSLFPNNCEPMMSEEELTPMRVLMEWLAHYCKPEEKNKNLWISPKYFFPKKVYEKILRLKEIFLQFDEDGSRKMEIDEMVTMFKTNGINVTEQELCSLFFKGKKYRKEDINKLYLDFYDFMKFGISKESDNDFRNFIRKQREEMRKKKLFQKQEKSPDKPGSEEDFLKDDEINEPEYLPETFSLILDFFTSKGEERKIQKKIRRAIKRLKNIIKPGTFPEDDKDFSPSPSEGEEENNSEECVSSESVIREETEKFKDKELEKELKETNPKKIMREFEKLFNLSKEQTKKLSEDRKSLVKSNSMLEIKNSSFKKDQGNTSRETVNPKNRVLFFSKLIRQNIEMKKIKNIKKDNMKKYKSISLANNKTQDYLDYYFGRKSKKGSLSPRMFEKDNSQTSLTTRRKMISSYHSKPRTPYLPKIFSSKNILKENSFKRKNEI